MVFVLVVALTCQEVKAGFRFKNFSTDPITIGGNTPNDIDYTFTVNFWSGCTSGCTGSQEYQLSFEVSPSCSTNNADGCRGSGPYRPNVNTLSSYIEPGTPITFTTINDSESQSRKRFSLGSWSGEITPYRDSVNLAATFTVRFKKSGLQQLLNEGKKEYSFYVVGRDSYSTSYHHSMKVTIPLKPEDYVKIVPREEIDISAVDTAGAYAHGGTLACLYRTSGNKVNLLFDGKNASANSFQLLSKGASDCSQKGSCVPYQVFASRRPGARTVEYKPGTGQNKSWKTTENEQCTTNNLYIEARVRNQDLQGASSGSYHDVLTITVSPAD